MHAAVFLLLAMAGTTTAPAAATPTIEYYEVAGHTLAELRRDVARLGPVGNDGRRHHAYTRWELRWSYSLAPAGRGCRTTSVKVDMTSTMILPRWQPAADASAQVRDAWSRYSAALRAHEEGHVAVGTAAAAAIEQALQSMRNARGCDALEEELRAAGTRILDSHKADEREYDATTRHGATQGAML